MAYPLDLEIAASFTAVAAEMGEVAGKREALLDEAMLALVQVMSPPFFSGQKNFMYHVMSCHIYESCHTYAFCHTYEACHI